VSNETRNGTSIYARAPISVHNGIPVFSERDLYVENYEKIAKDHVSRISETQENPFMEEDLWVSLERSTREYIRKYVAKGSKILDVGVGLGRVLEPLTEYDRYGVDISLEYLSIARSRGIDVALAKIEDLPYKAELFDAIIVCDVLEHVFDLNYCCEKILSCLRPGGVLIVRVPFKEDLGVYLNDGLPYDFIHLRNFDEASLRLHFQKIFGLEFLEAGTTTPYLQGTPRLKLRLLPEDLRVKIVAALADRAEAIPILNAIQISEEAFQTWIYELKRDSRALFDAIAEYIIYGIDVNVAFVKPYIELPPRRSLRVPFTDSTTNQIFQDGSALIGFSRDFLNFRHDVAVDRERLKSALDRVEQLIDSKTDATADAIGQVIEKLDELFSQQQLMEQTTQRSLTVIEQSVFDLKLPWYKKLHRKLRKILGIKQ
jgi:SAM-dependent methyltransferase